MRIKLITILMLMFLLLSSSCYWDTGTANQASPLNDLFESPPITSEEPIDTSEDKEIRTIAYSYVPWNSMETDVTNNLEITPYMAERIADIVFESWIGTEGMERTYSRINVIPSDNIIVIERWSNRNALGGGYDIAIDAKTGKILKMWFEE